MRESDFVFYADAEQADFKVVCDWELCFGNEFDGTDEDDDSVVEMIEPSPRIASRLVSFASEFGLSGNIWHQWIAYLIISDENPYSLACERRTVDMKSTMAELAKSDFEIIYRLFNEGPDGSVCIGTCDKDLLDVFANYKAPYADYEISAAGIRIKGFSEELAAAKNASEFADAAARYYEKHGAGIYGLYNSFRAESDDMLLEIVPIRNARDVSFDLLVGREEQKQTLRSNTDAFVKGIDANNVLLYGDSGTGKSTSVHALIHDYSDAGLRLVELVKRERAKLPELISELKKRNYKFIIYMDDLSFEEDESDYKELKAMLEGALESTNDNVLICATSNRRHLIRETWNDRNDMEFDQDVHRSDTMEEKLSLAGRFGLTIYYPKQDYKEYLHVVTTIAAREGLHIGEDELADEARKWSIRHGSTSGRTASQLVKWLLSR